MLATEAPFPQYFDADGSPLDAGYLYFGAVNQNPETNPITVYWDLAGTQPAAQPIRTLNGFAARNGSAAILYVAGDYSLTVKDKVGRLLPSSSSSANTSNSASILSQLVTYIAQVASSIGSSLVGFIQAGAGAIARTLQSKGRDNVHLFDFMSAAQIADVQAGTLTLDGAASLAAAIASLPAAGGTVRLPRGKVLLNSVTTLGSPGHIQLIGEGGAEAANNVGATELIKGAALTSAALVVNSPFASLKNFVLRGAVGNTGDGIQISANGVMLESVGVFAMGQDGVRIGLDTGINANSWNLTNCRFFNNGRFGLYVSDQVSPTPPNASAGSWFNCVSQGNTNDGVRIGNATLNSFFGGVVENNGGAGMRLMGAGSNYNLFSGVDFDSGNAAGNLLVQAGAVANCVNCPTLSSTAITDAGTDTMSILPSSTGGAGYVLTGAGRYIGGHPGGATDFYSNQAAGSYLRIGYGFDGFTDAQAQIIVGSLGLNLGKSSVGKIGFYGAAPVIQSAGWGTPTGAVKLASFPGASATLAQTSAQVAQLIADLKANGLLGA